MLGHEWAERGLTTGARAWAPWLDRHRDRLPARLDLAAVAARLRRSAGSRRRRVVLDPGRLAELAGEASVRPEAPLSADAADLGRRVAAALKLRVPPGPERARLLAGALRPRLATHPGPPPTLPLGHQAWVRRRAAELREALLAAGYPVVGDLDVLTEPAPDGVLPGAERTLALAVAILAAGPGHPEEAHS
ncbi:MAG: hypothetical protein R2731_00460 [Nocardioides sp.]